MLTALICTVARFWSLPVLTTQLSNGSINESSGCASSPQYSGVWYTHNDSGDSARFFRFREDGTSSTVTVQGAGAIDWEDMASARVGGVSSLYFADVGDNLFVRTTVRIYRVLEPTLNATSVPVAATYTLTYPDGRKNCEALIVDPASGDIYLVTKSAAQADVYRLPAPSQSGSFTLSKLGTLHPNTGGGDSGRLVTGASTAPNGKYVTIRTYTGALEFAVTGSFQTWWTQTPTPVTMPVTPQGEAIAYGQWGRTLFSTSEGSPCPVYRQSLMANAFPVP